MIVMLHDIDSDIGGVMFHQVINGFSVEYRHV